MKVITLLNEKGGVGKTTLATHIAAGLAIRGFRTLLIDTDAQEANATETLGVQRFAGIYNLLLRPDRPEGEWKSCLVRVPDEFIGHPESELWLVPSNAESKDLNNKIEDLFVLRDRLEEVQDVFDYVVIDCPPSPGLFAAVILATTDHLIIPTELERASAGTAVHATVQRAERNKRAVQRAGEHGVEIMMIVPNKYRRTDLHNLHLNTLLNGDDTFDGYGDLVWQEPIPNHTVIGEAAQFEQSLFAYAPSHATTSLFERLVERILQGVINGN